MSSNYTFNWRHCILKDPGYMICIFIIRVDIGMYSAHLFFYYSSTSVDFMVQMKVDAATSVTAELVLSAGSDENSYMDLCTHL